MGDVEQVAFIALPPALSSQGPLGAHYTTENASKATQAKDIERPPGTRWGLYHGPAVKVGYPLALPGPQEQKKNKNKTKIKTKIKNKNKNKNKNKIGT